MEFLDRWMRAQPGGAGRPLITYYDAATGERTELSGTTTANWVDKAANLLVDELDGTVGVRIDVALPMHWLRMVWIMATWAVGGTVVESDGDVLVVGPDDLTRQSPAQHRVASALLPFARPFPTPPAGHLDLGLALPGQPDAFFPSEEPTADTPAVELSGLSLTHGDLASAVPPSSERRLLTAGALTRDVAAILAALLGGGSLVLVNHASPAELDRLASQEQARLA